MATHESHERFHEDCGECVHEWNEQSAYYGALYRAEAPYRESIALAREEIDSQRTGDLDAHELALIQRRLK
jgi:hypothetical protein